MSYLEELLPEFRKGAKIRKTYWEKGYFVYFDCGDIWNTDNDLISFSGDDLINDCWELYQEPIDYDYIIKNKCVCCFWNGEEDKIIINTLNDILTDARNNLLFFDELGKKWKNCRPARRDEVTFYEDKKDENK